MKLEFLIILFTYVYYVLGEISTFIPKGQRAEIFEITDNEVPTFRITLPKKEFSQLKRSASSFESLDDINDEIKSLINLLNKQNFATLFPEYNFSEEFPELPMNEDGYPNIDENKFLIDYQEYDKLTEKYGSTNEILFHIYNDNTYLNLIKVIYMLCRDKSLEINDNILDKTDRITNNFVMDNDGNFFYCKEEYILKINKIVCSLNEQNITELFPGCNFKELLPKLPLKENGYPNIDYRKYIIPDDEYEKIEKQSSNFNEIVFHILNNEDYLNLINVIYTLTKLDSSFMNDGGRWNDISDFVRSIAKIEDGSFYFISEEYVKNIKEKVELLNRQNFTELFPGYNFTELLPELPMNENGHPNIDFRKYEIPYDEYEKLEENSIDSDELFFYIFNRNDYLNLIKVFCTLYKLDTSSKDDKDFWDIINTYGSNVYENDQGSFSFFNEKFVNDIESLVNSLNELNLTELFPEYNFKEKLPELPMNENGHPMIDYQKYIISYDEYKMLKKEFDDDYYKILFNIFNKDDYLNLIKLFHTLYSYKDFYKLFHMNVSFRTRDVWHNIYILGSNVHIDDNGNFSYMNKYYMIYIEGVVESLNQENFTELFPGYNFTEILPDLPMNENGHPAIEFQKYIPSDEEYQNLEIIYENEDEILFTIFNNDKYLNLIKVFYTLSTLNSSTSDDDDNDKEIWYYINEFGESVMIDSEGNFKFIKERNINYIKYIVDVVNKQNFSLLYPGYNFTEILPELPLKENGHPRIDYRKYIDPSTNSQDIDQIDIDEYIFNVFNKNDYLNLIKVFYTLNQLNISSSYEDDGFISIVKELISNCYMNDGEIVRGPSKSDDGNVNFNFNEFKTKNGKMTVEINNQKLSFNKITFSIGGQYSRSLSKPGFNLKIRGGKELFGRRQFKLRGDATEPSVMRTKLMCDIHNKLGLPSISANYATLYINDEYMGLYVLTDAYKESWIEYVYGEKDTKNLYKCDDCDLTYRSISGFENENKEVTDTQELNDFLVKMTEAESWTDVDSIFDIDQFYKEIAIELITDSRDHFIGRHNYYIYKNPQNNKWIYLLHDFDLDLGNDNDEFESNISEDFSTLMKNDVLHKFISNNMDLFNELLKEIIIKVFNPATLFPRIDEIKSFIRPYVQLDKTPNENGQYPGRINKKRYDLYSMEDWEVSTEFDKSMPGLKQFILLRYRDICKEYNMECDPNYLFGDGNINNNLSLNATEISSILTETEIKIETTSILIPTSTFNSAVEVETATTTSLEEIATSTFDSNVNEATTTSIEDTIVPTVTSTIDDTIVSTTTSTLLELAKTEKLSPPSETTAQFKCLSEFIGYPCCPSNLKTIYAQDDFGDWSYDFKKEEWCGLTIYEDSSSQKGNEECWSEKLGYPCCQRCKIYETDSDGSWGYEFNQWCGIISSHC